VRSLLARQVECFNRGVRTGEWAPMLELFAEDAELEFVGIPIGPFRGRDAIGEAYRAQPPDDEIVVLDDRGSSAVYAWSKDSEHRAGEVHIEERDGEIARVRILYEQPT
jgi:hypothetical protein